MRNSLVVWHNKVSTNRRVHSELRAKTRMIKAAEDDSNLRHLLVESLARIRSFLSFSQKQVAARMGTQQSAVSDLEKGGTDPRLSTLQRYARSLGFRIDISLVEDPEEFDWVVSQLIEHYSSWAGNLDYEFRGARPSDIGDWDAASQLAQRIEERNLHRVSRMPAKCVPRSFSYEPVTAGPGHQDVLPA